MPLYECECTSCSKVSTYVRAIDDRNNVPECPACGSATERIVSAVRGFADLGEYVSPASGKLIRGRRQREEDFKRTGTRAYEGTDSEVRAAKQIRADKEKREEKKLDEALEKTISELDASNVLERTGPRDKPLPDTSGMREF